MAFVSSSSFLAIRRVLAPLCVLVCLITSASTAQSKSGVWQYSKTADPIQGGSIAVASVTGDGVDALVRCWPKSGDLDVSFLLAPGAGRAENNSVTIGFDRRRDAKRIWRVSPSGLALVVPPSQRRKLLQRMQDAGNMRIHVATSVEPAAQLHVPLRGSSRAIRSVLRLCT